MLLFFRLTFVCKYKYIIELSNSFYKKINNLLQPKSYKQQGLEDFEG